MPTNRLLVLMITVIFFTCSVSSQNANAIEGNELVAQSAILMDKISGRVLFEKNAYEKKAMASTTKIMTCIIALENGNLDEYVSVSNLASRAPEVKLFLKEGENYRLIDLLHALMLESSNDAAIVIAEGIMGSVEAYCDLMTEKAVSIGALDTSFKTPNGLDAQGHYTTAYDLALITKYAMSNEEFIKIINTKSYSFTEANAKRSITVNNKNSFLNMYEGANGVKTGYTGDAGYCFVGAVKKDDKEMIVVLLACSWPPQKTHRWADTIKLMDYGFENFEYKQIIDNQKLIFRQDEITHGITNEVEGITTGSVKILCKESEKIDVIYSMKSITEAPINKNDLIGEAIIYVDGEFYTTVDIRATKDVVRIDLEYCINLVINHFITILG